ncbi:MAG TPA: hypothetical protein VHD34_10910 [Xanthobacteraceae bacterium]|nr:hypothetical protein [Xanthobacteraceae bacterium]
MSGQDMQPADPTQRKLGKMLDEALDDTFPASDPPAITQPAPTLPEEGFAADKNRIEKPN